MSDTPIAERQLDADSRVCWNPTYIGPMRQELPHDGADDLFPEQSCGNEACPRHGNEKPQRHGDPFTLAYKGHQVRRRLMALAQKQAATRAPAGATRGRAVVASRSVA